MALVQRQEIQNEDNILESFYERVQTPSYNLSEIKIELEAMAVKFKAKNLDDLFLLVETEQIPVRDCDRAMSLFSIIESFKS